MPRSRSRSRSPRPPRRSLQRSSPRGNGKAPERYSERRRDSRNDYSQGGREDEGERRSYEPRGDRRSHYRERRSSRSRSPRPFSSDPRRRRPSRERQRERSHSRQRSGSPTSDKPNKVEPNFKPSGLLAAATNTVKKSDGTSTVLKYNEPPEARRPSQGWRLYVFKGKDQVDLLHIHRQSAFLIGRDQAVADIPIEHPSCSKQHAVIQFRQIVDKDEWGQTKTSVKPFLIDLESTNGTLVNDETIPTSRYFELKINDVLKFGQSTREYVLLHDDI